MKFRETGKITVALVLSFLAAGVLRSEVFLADSPQVQERPFANILGNTRNFVARFYTDFAQDASYEELKQLPLAQTAPGVYASEKGNSSYTLIKIDEVEWEIHELEIDGKKVKVKVPRGETPLSRETRE